MLRFQPPVAHLLTAEIGGKLVEVFRAEALL
jgi:hypothetical protein